MFGRIRIFPFLVNEYSNLNTNMLKLLRTFGMCRLYQKGIGEIGVDNCNSFATVEKMVI
jgi:hypothetical protein